MASKGAGGFFCQTTSVQTACDHPFTIPGDYEDEITMEFSDNKQLYVSKSFLCLISPVFAKMFEKTARYVENKEKKIKMAGKSYDDILELLLHVHPRIQKEVNRDNVYKIIPLVEEYMIDGSKKRCRCCLMTILKETKREVSNEYDESGLEVIVDVLVTASRYGYNEPQQYAREILSKCTWGTLLPRQYNWSALYNKLPDDDKVKILEMRLKEKGDVFVPRQ